MNIPKKVIQICQTLKENGYEAYIVGGAVRDMLLNRQPHDFDIATNARPEKVSDLFKCYPSGLAFGTVTALLGEEQYEITTFRKDSDYADGRHPKDVMFADTIEEDLSRRDFTINAMAYDVIENRLIDPFNGCEDIHNKDANCGLIRTVGDARERFSEDALRMMRAARFRAQLGYTIEGKTYDAICDLHKNIEHLSKERIRDELTKTLAAPNASDGIRILRDTKMLKQISPVLDEMFYCEQQNKWHYTNVGEHTLDVLDNLSERKPALCWAALLHDIGKMEAKVLKANGEDGFYGHADISARLSDELLRELKFSNEEREHIVALVKEHSTVHHRPASLRRYAAAYGKEFLTDLHCLQLADAKAHTAEFVKEAVEEKKLFYKQCIGYIEDGTAIRIRDLKIDGNDLLALGLKGKQIRECLEHLYADCLGDPAANEREHLLRMAGNYAKNILVEEEKEKLSVRDDKEEETER